MPLIDLIVRRSKVGYTLSLPSCVLCGIVSYDRAGQIGRRGDGHTISTQSFSECASMLMTSWMKRWRQRLELLRLQRPRRRSHRAPLDWNAECLESRALLSVVTVTTTGG